MKKNRRLVVANWKMNPGSIAEARTLFLSARRASVAARRVSVAICPPHPFLPMLTRLANGAITLGAQDSFWRNGGPYTGETSPEILKESGAELVIVGHSERRSRGETDDIVSRKASAVVREGLTALVCVGEKSRDEHGDFFAGLREQIRTSFSKVQRRFISDVLVAYEPVWAVGKSWREAASPEIVREAAIFIRKTLADLFGDAGAQVPVLYGGSVGPENAEALLKSADIAGFLVGHESLDQDAFAWLVRTAHEL